MLYTHLEMEKEIEFPNGYYTPHKEVQLKHGDKNLFYVVGQVNVETSCCGSSTWSYVQVPGYVLHWQDTRDKTGNPVTEVTPIRDEAVKSDIVKIIQENEGSLPIEFW